MAPFVSAFISSATLIVAASAAGPCCKTCTPPLLKYYSTDVAHGFCGDACMDPKKFYLYKKFEPNLTLVDDDHPECSGQFAPDGAFYNDYGSTVTHGDPFGILKVTLDLYAPTGMPDHSCCSTPVLEGANCIGKPNRMTIRGTGPYCCPSSSTEAMPCAKEAATDAPSWPVHKSIAHHNEAFGALDVEKILLDFTNDSILRIFNQADGSLETWKGLAELRVGFTGLLKKFTNMSDVTVPVSIIEENSPQGPGGAFTAGSNPASGFEFFHDVFVADADGKLFRQDAFINYVSPAAAKGVAKPAGISGPVHESIQHHNEAFGVLDVEKILLDFTNHSMLRIFNQADGSLETWKGLAELRVGFTGLLKKFTNMSDVTVPVSIIEENSPQGPGGAFTAGSNKASGFRFFSDAFVADANGKLFRQNAFIHHVAPRVTKEILVV